MSAEFSCPVPFLGVDSDEYPLLAQAAFETRDLGGLTCEIGIRRGGSSEIILRASAKAAKPRPHVAIDPWGNLPYAHGTGLGPRGYDDEMRRETCRNLYELAEELALDLIILPWRDTDVFTRFADGIPFYSERFPETTLWKDYSLVFIDGPHTTELVLNEVLWFLPRMVIRAQIVFDDVCDYEHGPVHEYLLVNGCERVDDAGRRRPRKAVYQKVR